MTMRPHNSSTTGPTGRARSAPALGAAAALVLTGTALAQLASPDGLDNRPPPARGLELQNKLGAKVPLDLPFTESTGKQVTLGEIFSGKKEGKPVVLTMVYFSCPVLCPAMMEKLTDALNKLEYTIGTEYDVVVISFDPRDTVADAAREKTGQLLTYARPTSDSVRNGWRFLVSQPENARKLADTIGFPYRYLPAAKDYAHGPVVFVMTPEGRVSRYFTGLENPPQLAKDLKFAIMEASGGRIGTVFEQIALWCYHWNPEDGSYSLAAMRVMQLGAGGTAVALAITIACLFVHERRRRVLSASAPASSRAAGAAPVPTPALSGFKP